MFPSAKKILLSHWLPRLSSSPENPLPSKANGHANGNGTTSPASADAPGALPYLQPPCLARVQFDISMLSTENAEDKPTKEQEEAFASHVGLMLQQAERDFPFLGQSGTKWVAKPDQLIKRRGKAGLLGINLDWSAAKEWIRTRAGTKVAVSRPSHSSKLLCK